MPRFTQKPCECICLTKKMKLNGKDGEPGDWLVIAESGTQRIVKKDTFMKQYSPVNDEADAYLQEMTRA